MIHNQLVCLSILLVYILRDGPPVCAALNSLPFGIPPPMSYTISLNVVPIGTSTSPVFITFPPSANTFVPFDLSVPMLAYHFAPFNIIFVIFAYVSTLFISVGFFHSPTFAGNGGFSLGLPDLPSIDSRSAVSSPHTNAPAPSLISISNENLVPQIFSPEYSVFSCLFYCFSKSLYCYWILCSNIYVSFVSSYCISCYHHCFYD